MAKAGDAVRWDGVGDAGGLCMTGPAEDDDGLGFGGGTWRGVAGLGMV